MEKKHLLIDLSKSRHPCNGQGQFCILLGNELSKIHTESFDKTFLVEKTGKKTFPTQDEFRWLSHWHRVRVPSLIRSMLQLFNPQYDLWHVTAQDSEFWPLTGKTPVILTIHDLNFLIEAKTERRRKRRLKRLQKRVDRASYLTTISDFSASEIRRHLNIGNKAVYVIYNGGIKKENVEIPSVERPDFLPDDDFLFTIGTVKEKKNFHVLIPWLKLMKGTRLVISGNDETSYARQIREQAREADLEDRVFLTGEISNAMRDWLYQHCQAFVFPSLAEGFGIPVIEAMSYGKPVFISDKTSLPEVASKAGFYFGSFTPVDMLKVFNEGMELYHNDKQMREQIIQRSRFFSWEKSARQYHELYDRILAGEISMGEKL